MCPSRLGQLSEASLLARYYLLYVNLDSWSSEAGNAIPSQRELIIKQGRLRTLVNKKALR
jgi:hypothetical protein